MRRVNLLAAGLLAVVLAAPLGCISAKEQQFTVDDVRVVGMYLSKAQPAVERYCDALRASDPSAAEELRADTQALAAQIAVDQQARLDKLSADKQVLEAAQTAVNLARSILDTWTKKADANAATQPGGS